MDDRRANGAELAAAFGAKVQFTVAAQAGSHCFLVKASAPRANLAGLVAAQGGRVLLCQASWLIAELPFSAATALRRQPGVAFVGGLALDAQRFAAFRNLACLDPGSETSLSA